MRIIHKLNLKSRRNFIFLKHLVDFLFAVTAKEKHFLKTITLIFIKLQVNYQIEQIEAKYQKFELDRLFNRIPFRWSRIIETLITLTSLFEKKECN
ncbi:hypothetical protein C9J21_10085 [Photobacterium phosphoreum]|nr:hypothetical protein C9J21_10085 [Photobacterium phosphoreum]